MNQFYVTCYRGYSKVIGQIEFCKFFEQIGSNLHRRKIEQIEMALNEDNLTKADSIKRQLPFYTLTTNYSECRLPHSLSAYNDLPVLDFDEMRQEDIPRLRRLAEEDPATIACALSPRRHGLKLLVYLQTEEAMRLRTELKAKGCVTYAELEQYHKRMFELSSHYYSELLDSKVDPSGSDLGRGMYATYDPDVFFSGERLEHVSSLQIEIKVPTAEESSLKKRKENHQKAALPVAEPPKEVAVSTPSGISALSNIDPLSQLEYRKAVEYTKRKFRFEPNSRDSFIYCLGNQCYTRHIGEEDAVCMTLHDFGSEPDFNAETPLRNAYLYTNKTDANEEELKKPLVQKVIDFLKEHYEFRRNTILDRVEFRRFAGSQAPLPFMAMRGKDFNSIYTHLQLSSIYCSLPMLKAVVDSNFAIDFDPFIDYFLSLRPWDGKTDYIKQLAATVTTNDPDFWEDSLRRWLVGMVACALDDEKQNQEMLLLYSKQGKGKSTFIRNLLPDTLRTYYRNGMITPENKDHMLLLSTCLIINLEEFDGVSSNRLADLQRIITQEKITERKVYDTQSHTFIRHASFAASTNNPRCLQDIGENRRMLFNSIKSIDYRRPVNHEGIYSQALALYRQGFRFWYEGDEISSLNSRNENFRQKEPVEENLFFYFRPGKAGDIEAKWYPASHLLSTLSLNGRIQSNSQILKTLVTVLDENGFRKRTTKNRVTEYCVVEYSQEERDKNSVLPQVAEQKNLEL